MLGHGLSDFQRNCLEISMRLVIYLKKKKKICMLIDLVLAFVLFVHLALSKCLLQTK